MALHPVMGSKFRYVVPLVLIGQDDVKRTFFGEYTAVDENGHRTACRHGWTDAEIAKGEIVGRLNTITIANYATWRTNPEMERLCRAQFEPKNGCVVNDVCEKHGFWPCDDCHGEL